ncbi:uncharacterized protein [Spinacia oleracea]|uniref:Alpha/beta hydrolase fold-3 domain-containing protein n=1 Tax=Spinacia oleracea TaxID=3562 RepID=A0ABM3QQC6_SPIOL|nr:uncharacterized protein LOC110785616 [Spinacia oleracea]
MFRRGNKPLFLWRSVRNFHLPSIAAVLGLVIFISLLFSLCSRENPAKGESSRAHETKRLQFQVLPNPTVEYIEEAQVIWQIPSDPKAVLFIAHGCGGSALNFWDSCLGCPNCVGLPEEKRIVLDALAQNLAVLVVTSTDVCWSYRKDGSRVKKTIQWWLEKHDLVKSPLVGLGASSGGYFLSVLATEVRFRGIVLMISSGLFDRMVSIPDNYPPTLFLHMPKDVRRGRKIDRHVEMLRKKGIEVQKIECLEFPLTPIWLTDRVTDLNHTTSLKLFELFSSKGFIDAKGYMKNDGRATPWREALKQSNILLKYESKLMHHIEEELNLAYAYHEMTSLQSDQMFKWFKSHL